MDSVVKPRNVRTLMTARVMIQGCGSNVGKSMLVAGLCRAYTNRGLRVAPFKPQNMSNNAAVTEDGGEIGRAQALQALAARVPTSVHYESGPAETRNRDAGRRWCCKASACAKRPRETTPP